ncbi:sulfotransferase family protein [Crocosphaera sp. XPORK-15E]|uniref:sulfotransferase family protein n=1 Tax=Crocosphaera sp. XPORK-15E TaxID=3110247 RepID=UPI002B1EBCD0|nr:sulfotransferase family protein [Crocosphaera sp. XPORK-15E]MEA5534300.1 sulfotransferase family protein [Crocosphaera sp. XPORK-15E]
MRQYFRELKNNLADNYYQFRIDTDQNPYQIRFRKKPFRILFILSHMRSGSSLLTHLLNSNPEIIGYGETHINYASELDFKTLIFKVYRTMKDYQMNHKYVLDKVLHNHKFLADDFLVSDQVYSLFLIREPQRTLASILEIKPHLNEEKALTYYQERLEILESYAKLINNKKRSFFITYEQLINQSDLVLNSLKFFLETQDSFSEQYETLKTTGMRGIGDSSENIKAGHIIRNRKQSDIKISSELVEKATYSFRQCFTTLSTHCSTIETLGEF